MSEYKEKEESTELAELHQRFLSEYSDIATACAPGREESLEDRKFYSIAGAQWEGNLGKQFENKPKLEINKVHLSLIRIFSEYRNNPITVDFKPKDGKDSDGLADLCDGLYRADEQDSVADEAYDNAFEEGVGGGFGAWRLKAAYEDEEDDEDERQRILIEPIFDADTSVYFDLNAKRQDKSDAKYCFIITSMTRDAYEDEYGDNVASWPKLLADYEFEWVSVDVVYIAEVYRVEFEPDVVHIYETIGGEEERYTDNDFIDDEGLESRLEAIGTIKVREKKVKRKRVHKYIMSGGKILDDCGYIAGNCIPVVPFYGKRWFVDNIERFMGHVRLAKDPQRVKNMQVSKLAEISALSSVEKPMVTPEQIAGHQTMWENDNIENYSYLLINPITTEEGQEVAQGPVGYTRVPNIPPALAALLQLTDQDIRDILGNQEAGEQMISNISGNAIDKIQNRLDMQVFIYMDNFAKAMKRSGQIWLSMARDLYIEEKREMKVVNEASETSMETLNGNKIINEQTGEELIENDLSRAKFDIFASVGASSDSKRAATVRSLTALAQVTSDPETLQIINAMIMMNMDGEGLDDARKFFRNKLVMMGLTEPTKEEALQIQQAQANQQPSAQDQYLQAAAMEAEAGAKESNANVINKLADADKKAAETQEILAGIDMDKLKAISELVQQLQPKQEVVVPDVVQEGDTIQPIMNETTER